MVDEIYSDSSAESATLWEFFKIPHYRRQLFAGIVIIAGPQLSGMTLIFYFSDAIFRGAGIPDAEASAFTTGRLGWAWKKSIFLKFIQVHSGLM